MIEQTDLMPADAPVRGQVPRQEMIPCGLQADKVPGQQLMQQTLSDSQLPSDISGQQGLYDDRQLSQEGSNNPGE